MKKLTQQIPNAEARFEVIEEKLKQNERDHAVILETIKHNCTRNELLFAETKAMLKEAMDNKANKWVETVAKLILGAFVVSAFGVIAAIITGHLVF